MTSSEKLAVIDWDEAMEQCGDDEEFLRELLDDLRTETDGQIIKMDEALKGDTSDGNTYHRIMRASHVIKGAASNLMCQQLRMAAMALEKNASAAHDTAGSSDKDGSDKSAEDKKEVELKMKEYAEIVTEKYEVLKKAVEAYHAFLETINV
mmetsp:Transcript_18381/g.22065  ORF Transcript_18381/g.22065 Transcript_18381/m.22065 type:complete len:151 (-) Transcript_18381:168-620(-)|eukprot:CAMPEP_0195262400 /NCGR_PEP_ID=MMETSP0706-20130129/9734_1 /TAXON_ID=33640 /ORGANISM="Asterionellopsis glacialis, Strain CCMP134" /LENGTH=150 /DNA_ID=CAMNT_0040316477 /DNA_START=214 /DNA_END=666 /DNA_ORIENTATION=+